MKKSRQDGGRAIEGVLGGDDPEGFLRNTRFTALGGGHPDGVADPVVRPLERVGDALPGDFFQVFKDRRTELDVMTVRIDDRISETIVNRSRGWMSIHAPTSRRCGPRSDCKSPHPSSASARTRPDGRRWIISGQMRNTIAKFFDLKLYLQLSRTPVQSAAACRGQPVFRRVSAERGCMS